MSHFSLESLQLSITCVSQKHFAVLHNKQHIQVIYPLFICHIIKLSNRNQRFSMTTTVCSHKSPHITWWITSGIVDVGSHKHSVWLICTASFLTLHSAHPSSVEKVVYSGCGFLWFLSLYFRQMNFTGGYYKNVNYVCYSAGNAQPEGETKILLKDYKGKKALTVVSHMFCEPMALDCCKETCKAHCTEQSWDKGLTEWTYD